MSAPILSARIRYNANTRGKSVGDCVKRALTVAYSMDYDQVAAELNQINRNLYHWEEGYSHYNVYNKFIERRGDHFEKGDKNQTVVEFCEQHPSGVYLLQVGKTPTSGSSHLLAVVDGDFYDSWDSSNYYIYKYAVVKSGKSDKFEIDYEACLMELLQFEKAYLDDLNKKCPECMYVSVRSMKNRPYERDTGELTLKCLYGDKDMLPRALSWKANRFSGHTIIIKFNPRLSAEENVAILKKKIKQKTYDWVYNIRREILDEQAAETLEVNKDFRGDKAEIVKFPSWVHEYILDFTDYSRWENDPYNKYELEIEALPDDPRHDEYPKVRFYADSLTELKRQLNDYKENYSRQGYDY